MPVPVFVITNGNVAVYARLVALNESPESDKLIVFCELSPVPFSVTFCGEPVPLSVITSDAVRAPVAAGVKTIAAAQDWPAAR